MQRVSQVLRTKADTQHSDNDIDQVGVAMPRVRRVQRSTSCDCKDSRGAVNVQTTRAAGDQLRQCIHRRVDEPFGEMANTRTIRKLLHRGSVINPKYIFMLSSGVQIDMTSFSVVSTGCYTPLDDAVGRERMFKQDYMAAFRLNSI